VLSKLPLIHNMCTRKRSMFEAALPGKCTPGEENICDKEDKDVQANNG